MLTALLTLLPLILLFSGMSAIGLLALLTLALLLPHWRHYRAAASPHLIMRSTPLAIIALMLLWPLATAWHSYTPGVSLETALRLLGLMGLGALAMWLARHRPTPLSPRAVQGMALGLLIAALLIVQEALPGGGLVRLAFEHVPPFVHETYQRFMSKNMNRGLCALVVLVWPAALGLLVLGRRSWAMALPLLLLPAMLLMHSLSAKMGLLLGIAAFYGLLRAPRATSRIVRIVPALLLCWPLLFGVLEKPVNDSPALYGAMPESSQHRWEIWGFTLRQVAVHPWLGWGLDTSRAIPGGSEDFAHDKGQLPLHPHNNVLQVLLEEGIVGLLLTVAALGLLLRRWNAIPPQQRDLRAASGAAIISYLTVGLTAFGIWQGWWVAVAWLAAALLCYCHTTPLPSRERPDSLVLHSKA